MKTGSRLDLAWGPMFAASWCRITATLYWESKEQRGQLSNRKSASEALADTELEARNLPLAQFNVLSTAPHRRSSMKSPYPDLQTETIAPFPTLT